MTTWTLPAVHRACTPAARRQIAWILRFDAGTLWKADAFTARRLSLLRHLGVLEPHSDSAFMVVTSDAQTLAIELTINCANTDPHAAHKIKDMWRTTCPGMEEREVR